MDDLAQEFLSAMDRFGSWDDGCFYYNGSSAPELGWLIEIAKSATTLSAREADDTARLDWMIDNRAVVCGPTNKVAWLWYPISEEVQEGHFDSPRAAIDAAITAPKAPTAVPIPTFDGGIEVGCTSHGKAPTAGEGK